MSLVEECVLRKERQGRLAQGGDAGIEHEEEEAWEEREGEGWRQARREHR